jgi:hypothetical protein
VGVRHALFPRTLTFGAQCHPSSDSGCQLPDAASACMNDCRSISAPAAEPAIGVSASGFSGEASQPGLSAPAGALPPDPVRNPLRFGWFRSTLPQGRHRAFRPAVVGRAPRGLPLTPPVAFSSRSDDAVFRRLPSVSDLIAPPRSSPGFASRRLPIGSLTPRRPVSFFPYRLRHRQVVAAVLLFVQHRWMADHHTGSQ